MQFPHKTIVWLLAALLLGGICMAFTFWSFAQTQDASSQRALSRQVLNETDSVLRAVKDAELSERVFVLTSNESHLQAYLQARSNMTSSLRALGKLAQIPAARAQLDAAAPLVEAETKDLSAVVALRQRGPAAAVLAHLQQGEGLGRMNAIRTHMDAFVQIQAEAHLALEAAFALSMRRLFAALVVTGALALLLTLYFVVALFRSAHHLGQQASHELQGRQDNASACLQEANANLYVSEERLAMTLKSISDGVIATDANARITSLNPAAELLTGWSKAEALGVPIDEGAMLAFRDVTAQRQAQQTLQGSTVLVRNMRAIFDNEIFSSIATDALGVIQVFNGGAQQMLGYSASDVTDTMTLTDLLDPQELVERAQYLSMVRGTKITPGFEALVDKASCGMGDTFELTYIRKDGKRVPALVSVTALRDQQDTIMGYLLISTDNTARKIIEADRELLYQTLKTRNEALELALIASGIRLAFNEEKTPPQTQLGVEDNPTGLILAQQNGIEMAQAHSPDVCDNLVSTTST